MTEEWTGVIFGMGVLILGTIILVVVLTQASRLMVARNQRESDTRYAELGERFAALADRIAAGQEANVEALADVRARTAEIERMLREVD